MKSIFLASLVCLFVSQPLMADPAPERLAAAKQLADTMDLKKQMLAGFNAMLPAVDQQAAALQLDAAGKQQLLEVFRAWYTQDLDQEKMLEQVVTLYAETFTEQELKELNAFYSTPVGRRVLTSLPEIMQKAAQLGMAEAQSKQHLLLDRLQKFSESQKK